MDRSWLLLIAAACGETGLGPADATPEEGADATLDAGALPDAEAPLDAAPEDAGGDAGVPRDPLRVLFIGNSYTQANELPAVVAALSRDADSPWQITVERHTPPGQTWFGHDVDPVVTELIARGWDFVVLQDQSQQPWSTFGVTSALVSLDGKIRAAGAETVLYMTWARDLDGATGFRMNADVNRYYEEHAEAVGARVAPVGRAWERALRDPGIMLHVSDGSHPNNEGTYLAAVVIYATMTGEDPAGLGLGDLPVTSEDAESLKRVAAETFADRARPAPPLLGSWPLAADGPSSDLLPSDDLVLGDMPGPGGAPATGTRFGPGRHALALYFPAIDPPAATIAFYAHREAWSLSATVTEDLLTLPYNHRVWQTGDTLYGQVSIQGSPALPELACTVGALTPGWHHFALTHDGAISTLWVDGSSTATAAIAGDLGVTAASRGLFIGASEAVITNVGSINAFTGGLSRITLHAGALTADEIRDL
jgi:hypothetical protein